jgi:hypothetical protein
MGNEVWRYRSEGGSISDLEGFDVAASDGTIGHVEKALETDRLSYVIVDTGPWIFGKKVLLPAGVVDRVDPQERTVHVALTKQQIKDAPQYDPDDRGPDDEEDDRIGTYYAPLVT